MNALELRGLTKSYPDFTLGPIDLTLPGGCIMGLIGQNGAGKTTTLRLILGLTRRDGGAVRVLGRDNTDRGFRLTKEDIGAVPDEVGFPGELTAAQIGKVMKNTYRQWDAAAYGDLLDSFALPPNKPFGQFSLGMKRKLGLAVALSHDSKLLLLDEATSGLDPVVRDEVVERIAAFARDENHSVLISSHIVSDLEKLCDYVAFLRAGKRMLCEEKDALLARYGVLHGTAEDLKTLPPEAILYRRDTPYGVEAAVERKGLPAGVTVSPVGLEELFIAMVKEAK